MLNAQILMYGELRVAAWQVFARAQGLPEESIARLARALAPSETVNVADRQALTAKPDHTREERKAFMQFGRACHAKASELLRIFGEEARHYVAFHIAAGSGIQACGDVSKIDFAGPYNVAEWFRRGTREIESPKPPKPPSVSARWLTVVPDTSTGCCGRPKGRPSSAVFPVRKAG